MEWKHPKSVAAYFEILMVGCFCKNHIETGNAHHRQMLYGKMTSFDVNAFRHSQHLQVLKI